MDVSAVVSILPQMDFDRRSERTYIDCSLCDILVYYFSTCNFFFDNLTNWTMASYTNDSLDKLRKQDLIPIVLSLQSKLGEANNEANNKVLEEVRNLSDTISKLSSELSITKNVNTLLSNRLVTLGATMLDKCTVFKTSMSGHCRHSSWN